jgi:hypothetical protein
LGLFYGHFGYLGPFGTFSVHLVHFGIMYKEKSGNPVIAKREKIDAFEVQSPVL